MTLLSRGRGVFTSFVLRGPIRKTARPPGGVDPVGGPGNCGAAGAGTSPGAVQSLVWE